MARVAGSKRVFFGIQHTEKKCDKLVKPGIAINQVVYAAGHVADVYFRTDQRVQTRLQIGHD